MDAELREAAAEGDDLGPVGSDRQRARARTHAGPGDRGSELGAEGEGALRALAELARERGLAEADRPLEVYAG